MSPPTKGASAIQYGGSRPRACSSAAMGNEARPAVSPTFATCQRPRELIVPGSPELTAGVRGGRPTSPLRRNVQVWEHAAVWRRHDFRGRRRHLDSIGAAMAQVDDRSPATIHAVPGIDGVPIEMSTVGFRPILKAGSTTLDLAVRTPKA